MKVKNAMVKDVAGLQRSTTLREIIRTFEKSRLRTLPIVDEQNRPLGVIRAEDLLAIFRTHPPVVRDFLRATLMHAEREEDEMAQVDITPELGLLVVADEIMTREFVTIDEEATLNDARVEMRLHERESLLVVKDGALVGTISLFDMILAIFQEKGLS